MTAFTPGRNQDASHTIRGFKYQIQLTVLRWLELDDGEALYLECGEDIDRILAPGNPATAQRELEQVKARSRKITLRSTDSLRSLANFAAHIAANPSLHIRFRFTTTANYGIEKLSPLGPKTSAIQTWIELKNQSVWDNDATELASRIAQIIQNAEQPSKCSDIAWHELMQIVSGKTSTSLRRFIERFEWSCGAPEPSDLQNAIKDRIRGIVDDAKDSDPATEQIYNNLMTEVMETLSKAGEKILTTATLQSAIRKPTLSAGDRKRLQILEAKSSTLEQAFESLRLDVQSRVLQRHVLVFGENPSQALSPTIQTQLPGPPPLVKTLSKRLDTVKNLAAKLHTPRLLWIHGDYGTGKSHLSFLLAQQCDGILLGASTKGLTTQNAEQGILSLATDASTQSALESDAHGILLLDDLPDCPPQSRLETALTLLCKSALRAGRSIVLTSRHPPRSTLRSLIGDYLEPTPVPPFSDDEANQLLEAHGVDTSELKPSSLQTMNVACRGHPMLLTAAARYLLKYPDQINKAIVRVLFKNDHRIELDLETSHAVLRTVEGETCRNLLYRIAASCTALKLSEIRELASVEPEISETTSCVDRLDGLWLRRTARDEFDISPLATPLAQELPQSLRKPVQLKTAAIIFSRGSLSPSEFQRAVIALLAGGEHIRAASVFVNGCFKWPLKDRGYSDLGALFLFPINDSYSLPESLELPLRAVQAVSAAIDNIDFENYTGRIKHILDSGSPDAAPAALLCASLILISSLHVPISLGLLAARITERFLQSPEAPIEITKSDHIREAIHVALPVSRIQTWDDLNEFLEFLGELDIARREHIMQQPMLIRGMHINVLSPMFTNNQDLSPNAYENLLAVEAKATDIGLPLIAAHAVAGRIVVFGEYENDLEKMSREASKARKSLKKHPHAIAVIDCALGHQYFFHKDYSKVIVHLSNGLNRKDTILGSERVYRLVELIVSRQELGRSSTDLIDSLAELLADEEIAADQEMKCQIHGQLGLLCWRDNRHHDAFQHFEYSVLFLLNLRPSNRKHCLGMALSHTLNFYISMTESGQPPESTASGERFAAPTVQMFSRSDDDMANLWRVRQGPATIQWMLGRMAEALDIADAYASWTDRALDAAEACGSPALLALLSPRGVAAALRQKSWEDAIQAALIHGRAKVFLDAQRAEEIDPTLDETQFDPSKAPADPNSQTSSEIFSVWTLSRLMVVELAPNMLHIDSAQPQFESLADVIDRVVSQSTAPDAWMATAAAIRLAVQSEMNDGILQTALTPDDNPASESVKFIVHGLISLRGDVNLKQSAVSHAGVVFRLHETEHALGFSPDRYSLAVNDFWLQKVKSARFHFSTPNFVCEEIDRAQALPPTARVKLVLRTVLRSFSLHISNDVQAWLQQTD
ncbi:MAG: hypothetical protein ABL309_03670 [Phycisphaerales bacterium]